MRAFSAKARQLRALVSKNPDWDRAPDGRRPRHLGSGAVGRQGRDRRPRGGLGEIAHSFDFDPRGGRELFFYYGAHSARASGTAAGVKLARPNRQVICLVGDGSFVFGPTALWNMARLELPVITVVYNNHAYSGPHSRVIDELGAGGRIGADAAVLPRLPRQARHEHGGDRQGLRRRRRARKNRRRSCKAALARARKERRSKASRISSTRRSRAWAWAGPTSPGSPENRDSPF